MKKERGVNSQDFNKLNKTNMLSAKISREYKIAEYPLHQLVCVGLLEIHIALSNPSINVRTFSQGFCVAIVSRSIPDCELDIEQDEMHKALLIKQETE